jgi:hypothetical protein
MLCIAVFALTALVAKADPAYGPAAALAMDHAYRGSCCEPGVLHCFPGAHAVPITDCANIIPMTATMWTPGELCADFRRRMAALPASQRKQGIIVMLKTERCATKASRACTITTAALEKRSTPLVSDFLVYAVQLKPRDNDDPPGSLPIETGADAWKNRAAGEYRFEQGPGATLVVLDPSFGATIVRTNAARLDLLEWDFVKNHGRTPGLEKILREALATLAHERALSRVRSKVIG